MEKETIQQLERVVSKIRYGNVTLVIHDSRIVRIEAVEKIRLETLGDSKETTE